MSLSPSLVAHISNGPSPLAVFFDASGTTSSQTARPFHDLYYRLDYDDPDGGAVYAYGSQISKNRQADPLGGHVFQTPGTYDVILTVFDGVDIAQTSATITVTDPDTVFSGKTMVISPDADFTGAPAGDQATDTDWDNIINARAANGATYQRIRIKRGGTYTASATYTLSNGSGPGLIDTWGSGAKPIVTGAFGLNLGNTSNFSFGNWRIVDHNFQGVNDTATAVGASGGADNITWLRCDCTDFNLGISLNIDTTLDVINTPTKVVGIWTGWCLCDCTMNSIGTYNLILPSEKLMLLGSSFTSVSGAGGHVARMINMRYGVVSSCTFDGTAGVGVPFTVRAAVNSGGPTYGSDNHTEYVVTSDCKMIAGNVTPYPIDFVTALSTLDERLRDVVTERNWLIGGPQVSGSQSGIVTEAQSHTIRNNLIDTSASTVACSGIALQKATGVVAGWNDSYDIYNNTIFTGATSASTYRMILVSSSPTNVRAKNNLCYAPNYSGTVLETSGAFGAGSDISNNSVSEPGVNGIGDDPSFVNATPTLPAHFELDAASYGIEGGANWAVGLPIDDFLGAIRRRTGAMDMGAFTVNEGVLPPISFAYIRNGGSIVRVSG